MFHGPATIFSGSALRRIARAVEMMVIVHGKNSLKQHGRGYCRDPSTPPHSARYAGSLGVAQDDTSLRDWYRQSVTVKETAGFSMDFEAASPES